LIEIEQQIRQRLDARDFAAAFELLIPHFQNKVFRLAYSMLGNESLAEETAQDIFIRIWKALGSYRGQSSISTWIYSIARNTCLTALASAIGKRTVSMHDPAVQRLAERRASTAPIRDHAPDVELLLSELPETYRSIVTLFYMEDKSYEEVSRLLGIPMGTVKSNMHRARKQLAGAVLEATIKKGTR